MLTVSQVKSEPQIVAVQGLLREYIAWVMTLAVGSERAPTFQGLDQELATLPGVYTPPAGRLLLATQDGEPAGCVALKPHDRATCELKRLYVRPSFRGLNLGRQLVNTIIEEARTIGYQRMVLDSHISMKPAHRIYQSAGFTPANAPPDFPAALKPFVVFMECDLSVPH